MKDYVALRRWVGRRVRFRYDTGATVVGVLLELRPAAGIPQMAILKDADIVSSLGGVLGHHDQLSVVPNALVEMEEHPLPAISFRRPSNP